MNKIKYLILILLILSAQSVYAAKLLYSTGFENETAISEVFYTNNTDYVGYPPDSKVAITTSNPHSGKKSIRGNVRGGISGIEFIDPITGLPAYHDPHLNIGSFAGSPTWGTYHSIDTSSGRLYISYWMRWDSGANLNRNKSEYPADQGICAQGNVPGAYKMLLMSNTNNMDSIYMNAGKSWFFAYDNYLQMFESSGSVQTSLNNDGTWHHFEYWFQYETAIGAGNGILRVWRDGTKIKDITGLNFKAPGASGLIKYYSFGFVQYTRSSCDSSGWQIDDIEVWDDNPNKISMIIAPIPSVTLSPKPPTKLVIQ